MAVTVQPTLELMAEVYGRSSDGGADSDRFAAYVAAGAATAPVHGYNPMTTRPVLPVRHELLALDAERHLLQVAEQTLAALDCRDELSLHVTVATPGMWTDRLATEVDHRLGLPDPGGVLWWSDAPVTARAFDAEVVAQVVRLVHARRAGPPRTVAAAVLQEGRALAIAGVAGHLDPLADEALAVLGEDRSRSSMVAFLYGDEAAIRLGFTPVGLGDHVGYCHAVALAARGVPGGHDPRRGVGAPG
jgi:hypothetical protein